MAISAAINLGERQSNRQVFNADSFHPTLTAGAIYAQLESATYDQNRGVFAFEGTADSNIQINIPNSRNYFKTNGFTFKIKSERGTAGDANVGIAWGCKATFINPGEAIERDFGTGVVETKEHTDIEITYETDESGTVTASGTLQTDSDLCIVIYRDVSDAHDDLDGYAYFKSVEFNFNQ